MKKFMILAALVALVVAALALPALAHEANNNFRDFEPFEYFYGLDDEEEWNDYHDWWKEWRDELRDEWRNNDEEIVPAVSQQTKQEAESGDVNQSFNVSSTGDNSNQSAGIQGVANTGNAQNQIGVIQYGSEAEDFEFEDSGASITVSPNSFTSSEQQVNQAATAYGR